MSENELCWICIGQSPSQYTVFQSEEIQRAENNDMKLLLLSCAMAYGSLNTQNARDFGNDTTERVQSDFCTVTGK